MNILKSIGVILLGFVINALLSVLTDFLLEKIGILPTPDKGLFETWAILLVLTYRFIYTIFTGFIVAHFAPKKPLLHVLILGLLGTAITALAFSNPQFSQKSPLWFGYVLAAFIIPCLWLGAKIQQKFRNQ